MKPKSCRNCGKELWDDQIECPECGRSIEEEFEN
ncbi:zinc-ribbon domain-containing protein [Nitrosopumilus sp. K4]|nr:zinc-ribbon domain-containing protein [Nitrosopumilus sp. K4]